MVKNAVFKKKINYFQLLLLSLLLYMYSYMFNNGYQQYFSILILKGVVIMAIYLHQAFYFDFFFKILSSNQFHEIYSKHKYVCDQLKICYDGPYNSQTE